jgi:hypothetical protein
MRLNISFKYLCVAAIAFASCRASRNVAVVTNDEMPQTIAVAVAPKPTTEAANPNVTESLQETTAATENTQKVTTAASISKAKKKITSFAQMKDMARSGEISMSKKDIRVLNRLEKHYKGDYQKFRSDAFELTDKAKIIGGVGILGLLLAIITGSAFGWFLFMVAALAFLLRYLDIISF